MDSREALLTIGLSDKEACVYLSLLELGPSTISKISQKTGIHRPLVYKALPLLQEHGLVNPMPRGKQTLYVAESPDKLEGLLEQLQSQFKELIPQLKSIHRTTKKKPIVKFLEGRRAITSVFDDLVLTLKRGDVFYRYSSVTSTKKGDSYLSSQYRKKRDSKQLERLVITSEARSKEKKSRLERTIRVVPEEYELFDYDVTQVIYGSKVAFIDYNSETAIVIENKMISEFQKRIFKLLFKLLK